MKILTNNKGITLVEVLAVLVLTAIIGVLLYTVLLSFLKAEKDVTTDAILRDEADYYMSSFINYIYTLKESNLCGSLITSSNPSTDSSSYIKTKDATGNCTSNSPITGFYLQDSKLALYINGTKLNQQNDKIEIDNSSKLEKVNNVYKITLTLHYNGKLKTYYSEIQSINDI